MPPARDPIERVVAVFRASVEAADVAFDDPEAAGSDAADFVVSRHGRRHQVTERVGPVDTTDDLARYLAGPRRTLNSAIANSMTSSSDGRDRRPPIGRWSRQVSVVLPAWARRKPTAEDCA